MNNQIQTFTCPKPKCKGKSFDSIQALRMHNVRVHTRAGQLGARKGAKAAATNRSTQIKFPLFKLVERKAGRQPIDPSTLDPLKAEQLRKKREYNTKLRKQFIARGLTSTGKPRKRGIRKTVEPAVIEARSLENQVTIPAKMMIRHCPGCGLPLDPYYLAASIASRISYEQAKEIITRYETDNRQ